MCGYYFATPDTLRFSVFGTLGSSNPQPKDFNYPAKTNQVYCLPYEKL